MKLEIKAYGCLCELKTFRINDKSADKNDFGSQDDKSPDTAEEYGCGDMTFTGCEATKRVLLKYGITKEEYDEVVSKLVELLSFGCCGLCI